jgi:hypothetical protein
MHAEMAGKIDELIISNAEINQSYKTLLFIIKSFVAGCSIVLILFIMFMIQTREDIATIKATLATTENIISLKSDLKDAELRLHNEMGIYISLISYIEIEKQKAITVADLFCIFGDRYMNIKEEELERFRTTAIFKLNNNLSLGTTRDKSN